MTIHEKLKQRLELFNDTDELVSISIDILQELKGVVPEQKLYYLRELLENTAGLYDLSKSSTRAVKALERGVNNNE